MRTVQEIVAAYEAGRMGLAEMPAFLMDIIDEKNVDGIIAALPDEYRNFFLEWANGNYLGDDWICVGGEHSAPPPDRALVAIRDWFARGKL